MKNIKFITSMNQKIYDEYGKKMISSFDKNSRYTLDVYSEDEDLINAKSFFCINHLKKIKQFQAQFRKKFHTRFDYFDFTRRMDIWCIKTSVIEQVLSKNTNDTIVWLDADSIVLNSNFDRVVQPFVEDIKSFGMFMRRESHLHPESGFAVFNSSNPDLLQAYKNINKKVFSFDFYDLPSWTDCSLAEWSDIQFNLHGVCYCEKFSLKSPNPVLESSLSSSFIHLKGRSKNSKLYFLKSYLLMLLQRR